MQTNGYVTHYKYDQLLGEYVFNGSFPAWIYSQERTRAERGGVYGRSVFDVRFPLSSVENICTDDLIRFEKCTDAPPCIEKCFRIAAVTKNSFGSFPHWHIEAENQYR